jgi:Ni/Co efflux regulator RcnB
MKTKLIASALIALSFASGSAFAQRGDHGNDRNDHDRNGRVEHRDNDRHNNGRNDRAGHNDRNDRYYNAQHFRRDDHRGAGPRHDMRRGQRLSQEYRSNRYVVSDWRDRRLSAPPRGHHWVRAGNDYVLAAIATGIIAQVLLSN